MPNITFMRHAKTTYNTEKKFAGSIDCNTTEAGLEAARNSFKYTEKDFDYIYCSPLKRTMQTLDAIMPNHGKAIIDKRIAERHLGAWEGMPYENINENLRNEFSKGLYNPPESEPFIKLRERACDFVKEMFKKYDKDTRILVISHGGIIRQVRDNFLPDMEKTLIDNASILIVTNKDYEKYINKGD